MGWDGNYSFNTDGTRIPVESLVTVAVPRAPLSGVLQFNATGAGSFDQAVHSLTGQPAKLFGLEGRGILREGYAADLMLFDSSTVARGP